MVVLLELVVCFIFIESIRRGW